MSRCYCCDATLTDFEATRKSKTTRQYLDMCNDCFSTVSDVFIEIEAKEEAEELEKETQIKEL